MPSPIVWILIILAVLWLAGYVLPSGRPYGYRAVYGPSGAYAYPGLVLLLAIIAVLVLLHIV